jgi:TonB family protein
VSGRPQQQRKSLLRFVSREGRDQLLIGPWVRDEEELGPDTPHRGGDHPFCALEDELRAALADEVPVHPLPDAPRERRGPIGFSTIFHVLVILALILESRRPHEARPEVKPDVTIEFKEPVLATKPEEKVAMPPQPKAAPPKAQERPLAPPAPEVKPPVAAKPITPPPVPKEIPPPEPLPKPTRMGELVPVPHIPVPGTVPPEEGKSGRPGPPQPEKTEPEKSGDEKGTNETDPGFGPGAGPGAGGAESPLDAGTGQIKGDTTGNLIVPRPKGGLQKGPGTEGGGRRHGLNLELPPESGAFGDFAFDDKDYDWSDYYSQMYWSIWRAWHNRLYAMTPIFERWSVQHHTRELKGSVLVRFVIERSGSVSTIEVLEASTLKPLDDSAQAALREVILPPLPDDFPKDREGVSGRFLMEVPDLESFKYGLRMMKYRGIF